MGPGSVGAGETPLFLQIASRVSDDIIDGVLAEGAQAPSTNEIAALWGINPATALKGIHQLVADGVLYKQRGIGMFVAAGAREQLLTRRRGEFAERYVRPLVAEAERIGLGVQDVVALIERKVTQ